ncbi:amidohydrolase family protein [Amphiplicatus metriothermophilus]|uniref:Amidohydrolase family protein n=1 Tax=Amphiplicatus metriothermophilus TaxID=1519374 RepID=A0A239PJN0_9PROT|nr:amidohydrolase family protein [Amphiplicatus metriothermophilus]MBB5517896.1 imidazolonepropionase-like amidohydrolase [Amphiplicatus metriothermophilus]SNT67770.1 Amidohydrolase family protein [Amphiplicatus metriothermophilus]
MTRTCAFRRGCAAAGAALAAGLSAAYAGDMLITNAVVVSPERDKPSRPVSVYISEGRIAEIARRPSRKARAAATVIDAAGKYLAPGLIDGHVHLDGVPGMLPRHEEAYAEIAAAARGQIPRSYLFYGFTTVIDLNSTPARIAEWNAQTTRPHAYFCGGAPIVDGYPTSYAPKPLRYQLMPYFLFDPERAGDFPEGYDPTGHSPEAVVARMSEDGAICVKTFYEDGFGDDASLPVPSIETVRALVAAAHARGMKVLLHANAQEAQAFGLAAGVDAMAHGLWTWADGAATALTDDVAALLDAIAARGTGWQPTIQVLYGERDLFDPAYLASAALKDALPQSLIDWYGTEDGRWFRTRLAASPYVAGFIDDGRWAEIDAAPIARVEAALGRLAARGGRLLFGSDTPSAPTYANPPGLNGRVELQRWIEAGVDPARTFRAATIGNAEFFGLDGEIGTVEEGKQADLLVLEKNPLEDPSAYDAIDMIIVDGEAFPRAALSARAGRK